MQNLLGVIQMYEPLSLYYLIGFTIKYIGDPEPEIKYINPLMINVPYHIETSQLICVGNQLTGFYMMGEISCSWVKFDSL